MFDHLSANIPAEIFRAYDIRGVVSTNFTPEIVHALGRAIGTEAASKHQSRLVVARDGRVSSPALLESLIIGLRESGRDVIDIGMVPTPVLYFATYAHWFKTYSGIMLTGSHNPADHNGLKIVLEAKTLAEADIQALYRRVLHQQFNQWQEYGSLRQYDISQDYINRITGDVHLQRPLTVVVDAGNGVTGMLAPQLFRQLGCNVIELFCEVDGTFPHHHPDPMVAENLHPLQQAVVQHQADVGFAFDGDGDRLGVVSDQGEIILPDRYMMLFAQDVLSRNPGAEIIFDVKCTRNLPWIIEQAGGKPLMWKTGHSLIKAKLRESGALLAGEMSGHIFFKDRWFGFDDGLYTGARLLEILSHDTRKLSVIFQGYPNSINTPEIKVPLPEQQKVTFMQQLAARGNFQEGKVNTIDGMRVDFVNGWGLVRMSNTTACLTLRFEADDEAMLQRIQTIFREQMLAIDPALSLPF